jgi:ABC-type amino acid transport substrate-binding protein
MMMGMRRPVWRAVLLGLCLCLGAAPARAAVPVYRVGVEDLMYLPYYANDQGDFIGYGRELLDAFAKAEGLRFVYVPLPVVRLFATFLGRSSDLDFKFPDNSDWQADMKRHLHVVYSEPVVGYIDGVMVLPQRKGKGVSMLHTLGTIAGFTPIQYEALIQAGKLKVEEYKNFTGLLNSVRQGKVDGAYLNVLVAQYQLDAVFKANGGLEFDSSLPYVESSYRVSTLKHPELIQKLNQFLLQHKAEVEGLKRKHHVDVIH